VFGGHKEFRGTCVEPVEKLEVSLESHCLPYTQRCRLHLNINRSCLLRGVERAGLSGN
jgi:hypothetical protein